MRGNFRRSFWSCRKFRLRFRSLCHTSHHPLFCFSPCDSAAAAAAGGVGGGGLKGPGQVAAGKYSGAEARYIADASMEWARFEGLTMPVGHRRRGRHHAISLDARWAEAHGAAAKKRRAAAVAAAAGHEQHRRAVAEARASSAGTAKIESKGKGVKQHRGDQHAHASSRGSKLASSSSSGKKQLADVGDEHAEDEGGSESGPHVFNPREAAGTLQGYMAQHPDFASSALAWVVVGSVLFFVAILVLIFSEVRVVLVVRDQDFRTNMSKRGYMHETDKLSELELREQDTVAARPYLTAGSMVSHTPRSSLHSLILVPSFRPPPLPPTSSCRCQTIVDVVSGQSISRHFICLSRSSVSGQCLEVAACGLMMRQRQQRQQQQRRQQLSPTTWMVTFLVSHAMAMMWPRTSRN